MNSIAQRLVDLRSHIPAHVRLIAVSKKKSIEEILEAHRAGQRDMGENYVQELCEKQSQLPLDIQWHFIGHLQSNKVKLIATFIHTIHAVDSLALLKEINKRAEQNNRTINCLLQVFIAKEETKFGMDEEDVFGIFNSHHLAELKNIRVCGLMGMASNTDVESTVRNEFRYLKNLFTRVKEKFPESTAHFTDLSMGMTSDWKIAVEEGSTMVRIGSAIFGERD